MNIEIIKYSPERKMEWDAFVTSSKNATFLFYRDFMDYHADRFTDYSLMIYQDDKLAALFPACEFERGTANARIASHGGLTYGGVLSDLRMSAEAMLEIFDKIKIHYHKNEFHTLIYKVIPHIYHCYPAEEDIYALFRSQAALIQVDNSTCIAQDARLPFAKGKKYGAKKAAKEGVSCRHETTTQELKEFFDLLNTTLAERHEAKATHTFTEMPLLQSRFPDNIKLHAAYIGNKMVAGVLMFVTGRVAHTQYMATSAEGREAAALDLLLHELITDVYTNLPYFNFGISNEEKGMVLNTGLCRQKEMLGGRSIAQMIYRIDL